MEEENYKLKREKNNQSVKKCRENEKRKMELATEKLEEYKKENKLLDEKYTSLQKELAVLKSLFIQSSASNSAPSGHSEDSECQNKKQKSDVESTSQKASKEPREEVKETDILEPFEFDILSANFEFKSIPDSPFTGP